MGQSHPDRKISNNTTPISFVHTFPLETRLLASPPFRLQTLQRANLLCIHLSFLLQRLLVQSLFRKHHASRITRSVVDASTMKTRFDYSNNGAIPQSDKANDQQVTPNLDDTNNQQQRHDSEADSSSQTDEAGPSTTRPHLVQLNLIQAQQSQYPPTPTDEDAAQSPGKKRKREQPQRSNSLKRVKTNELETAASSSSKARARAEPTMSSFHRLLEYSPTGARRDLPVPKT